MLAMAAAIVGFSLKVASSVWDWAARRVRNGSDPASRIVRSVEATESLQRELRDVMGRLDEKLSSLPTHMELSREAHQRIEAKLDDVSRDVLIGGKKWRGGGTD